MDGVRSLGKARQSAGADAPGASARGSGFGQGRGADSTPSPRLVQGEGRVRRWTSHSTRTTTLQGARSRQPIPTIPYLIALSTESTCC